MESILVHNRVRKTREKFLMTKTELARNAGISRLTVDRIEKGMSCRIETKRKIILAFGYDLSHKGLVFKNG
ncbi:MAG: helix-turn-helix domain-containing protein [Desulfobacteraceae bacterium]|jgi:DNA-binding XRE family transcriptional regulator